MCPSHPAQKENFKKSKKRKNKKTQQKKEGGLGLNPSLSPLWVRFLCVCVFFFFLFSSFFFWMSLAQRPLVLIVI